MKIKEDPQKGNEIETKQTENAKSSSDSPVEIPPDVIQAIQDAIAKEIRAELAREAAAEKELKDLTQKLPKGIKVDELGESAVERLSVAKRLIAALPQEQRKPNDPIPPEPKVQETNPFVPISERSRDFHKSYRERRAKGQLGILVNY